MKGLIRTSLVHMILIMAHMVFFQPFIFAQNPPIIWGDIADEDLRMRSFPQDTHASAVILCDYGKAWFTGDFNLVFERHVRIKLLSESGYELGRVTIPFHSKKNMQKVNDIKGQTYLLSEKGKIKKHKLSKKSIIREDIDTENAVIRFTLPEMTSNSLIEYCYKIISTDPKYLPDWYFQSTVPTLWSEYRISIPENLEYITIFRGDQQLTINESKPFKQRVAIKYESKAQGTGLYTGTSPGKAIFEITGLEHRMVMKDIPAIEDHPFRTTLDDYRIKLEIQLSKIYHLNVTSKWASEIDQIQPQFRKTAETTEKRDVLSSWNRLAQELMDSKNFGKQIQKYKSIQKLAMTTTAGIDIPEGKIQAILNILRSTVHWNGQYRIFVDRNLDKVFQTEQGSNAEIALLLTSMLRDVGLKAHPVLISTRNHGKIQKRFPIIDQFNHVLVHVMTENEAYFLDFREPMRPFNLPPVEALNGSGWLVDRSNPRWIEIKAPGKYDHQVFLKATLHSDGSLTSILHTVDRDYSALSKRQDLKEKDDIDFIHEHLLPGFNHVRIDSFSIQNKDIPENDLIMHITFSISDFIQTGEDTLILNPILVDRYKENPFASPQRSYPVDFAYPQVFTYTLNLQLPEGHIIARHPENFILYLPHNSGKFSRIMEMDDHVFQLTNRLEISKARFGVREYDGLREFYDRIVEAHSEHIVLRK